MENNDKDVNAVATVNLPLATKMYQVKDTRVTAKGPRT